jgi:hypothetical protein
MYEGKNSFMKDMIEIQDFQIILFQGPIALLVEKFKDFIIKSHKMVAGNHFTPFFLMVW